jgi:DNA-binding transcriptional ArsR family regulator
MLRVSQSQAVTYRLAVNHLSRRLPAGSYVDAAYVGLQDTAPRDALLGLHARVAACEPSAWEHPRLIQTYSPRWAVYVLPQAVGQLAAGLPVSRSAVSQHLKILKDAGLVEDVAAGTRRIYRLNPVALAALRDQLDTYWQRALAGYADAAEAPAEEA